MNLRRALARGIHRTRFPPDLRTIKIVDYEGVKLRAAPHRDTVPTGSRESEARGIDGDHFLLPEVRQAVRPRRANGGPACPLQAVPARIRDPRPFLLRPVA